MQQPYRPYIPKTPGEVMDQLAMMMLKSPTFLDKTGFFPRRNIDSVFVQLNEGLENIRGKMGEARYQELVELSHKMRSLFEADPETKTGETIAAREIIVTMREMIQNRKRA